MVKDGYVTLCVFSLGVLLSSLGLAAKRSFPPRFADPALMRRAVFFIFLLTLGAGFIWGRELRGVWRTIASLPAARQEVGVAELDGQIYVIGGLTSSGEGLARVDIYDPPQNSWRQGPTLPLPLHHVAAVAAAGKVYSIGGFSGSSFSPVNTVLALDPATSAWAPAAPLPTARGALAAAVIEGKIYAAGGSAPSGNSRELALYDPSTDSWTVLAPMPTARNHHAAAAIEGKLYVVGGRSPNLGTLEVYDPASGTWETRTPMPTARSGIAAAAVAGFLFVFGGEIPGVFKETEVYDPAGDDWFALDPMPVPRHGIGAAVLTNRILIPGGATLQGLGATDASDELVVLPEISVFAQFAESTQISSQLVLTNSTGEPNNLLVELRDDSGNELSATLSGTTAARFARTLSARATESLSSPGSSPAAAVGAALVFSEQPLLANLLFSSPLGFAGVPGQRAGRNFLVSLQRNRSSGVDSGIALANLSRQSNSVTLLLRDQTGTEIASQQVNLAPLGHTAKLLGELFDAVNLDNFQGSLAGSAAHEVAAMAILLRPNQMATLPVQVSSQPF